MSTVVDPAYLDTLAGLDDEPAPAPEVGNEPIPRFDYYHVRFTGAQSGFYSTGTAYVRPTVEVLNGPTGSKGRFVSDDIYISVSPIAKEKDEATGEQVERQKSDEEIQTGVAKVKKTLRRIAAALKFQKAGPATLTEEALRVYASAFADREGIVAIRVEKAKGNFDARNRIVWLSLRAPSDAASAVGFSSAIEEANSRIQKANAKKQAGSGRTVGGLRPRGAELQ